MNRTKLSLAVILVTILAAVTLFILPITPRVPVKTALIARGSLTDTLLMTATVTDRGEQVVGALVDGRVSEVFVSAGDEVKAGDRLFLLDDSQEQKALSALLGVIARQEGALSGEADAFAALRAMAAQNQIALYEQSETLKQTISLKTVRAESDGVVRQVYIKKGELLPQLTAAMLIGSSERELTAVQRAQDMARVSPGMTGLVYQDGERVGDALVSGFSAPSYQEALNAYVQTLHMDLTSDEALALGEQAQVRLLISRTDGLPLAPLGAVSETGRIWVVRDGKAYAEAVDLNKRSDAWLAVGEELEGLPVVLAPDEKRLKNGCAVKQQ